MQPAITDEQILSLLPRCQAGEEPRVEALYDLYADRLYRYLLARVGDRDAAADLTTELFLRVIRVYGRVPAESATRPAASFSAWLYRIAGEPGGRSPAGAAEAAAGEPGQRVAGAAPSPNARA